MGEGDHQGPRARDGIYYKFGAPATVSGPLTSVSTHDAGVMVDIDMHRPGPFLQKASKPSRLLLDMVRFEQGRKI
jgi:hypothetical protein